MSELAILSVSDQVATITLNRPSLLNALDLPLALRLEEMVREVSRMDDVRVLVLRGAGRAFSSGGDLASFIPFLDNMEKIVTPELGSLHNSLIEMRQMAKIVVTSVQGSAAGGGLSLALSGDLCVAARDARFTTAYRYVGVSPDVGGSHSIVHAVGPKRAAQLFFQEKNISAEQAADWGLVSKIFEPEELDAATQAYARQLAAENHPRAILETKRLIYRSVTAPLADQLAEELRALLRCMDEPAFPDAARRFAPTPA